MAKLTLNDVANLLDYPTSTTTINNNWAAIETAVEKTLSRDGTSPNTMGASLDMNSNHILNLPYPSTSLEPIRLMDVITLGAGVGIPSGGSANYVLAKTSAVDYEVEWKANTGTGSVVLATSPTITTPTVTTSIVPTTNDGATLGTTSLKWSDLFLASGSVINWNSGDISLTHSTDLLTMTGGNLFVSGGYVGGSAIRSGSSAVLGFDNTGGYNRFYDGDGSNVSILMGSTTAADATNYYRQTTHRFQAINAASTFAVLDSTKLDIIPTTVSSSTTTGALVVSGGLGIGGMLNGKNAYFNIGSVVPVGAGAVSGLSGLKNRTTGGTGGDSDYGFNYSYTDSGNTNPLTTAAFRSVGTWSNSTNTSIYNSVFEATAQVTANTTSVDGIRGGMTVFSGTLGKWSAFHAYATSGTITNKYAFLADSGAGSIVQNDTTASTSSTTGALTVAGGVGIAGALHLGAGFFPGSGTYSSGVAQIYKDATLGVVMSAVAGSSYDFYLSGRSGTGVIAIPQNTNNVVVGVSTASVVSMLGTTASTSTTTGALTIAGGVGIAGAVYVGGNLYVTNGIHTYVTTAPPAGGTANVGVRMGSSNHGIFYGSGAPTLSAAKGSLYIRSDGSSTTTRAYVNTDGSTTWTYLTAGA